MTRRLVVGALVVDDLAAPTRLLAARRTTPPELAGRWELPGGKVEPGETPQQALHRELHEELAVAVEVGAELPGPDQGCWPISAALEMRLWFVRVVRGWPQPLGSHDLLRWLTPPQWDDVAWLAADVAVVPRLREVWPAATAAVVDGTSSTSPVSG